MAHHKIHDAELDRPAAAARPRPAAARAAPAVDRRDAQPGRDRGPGGPAVRARTTRRSPARCLAAARDGVGRGEGPPGHATPPGRRHRRRRLRRQRRHRRVLLGGGRAVHHHRRDRPTADDVLASPLHTADVFAHRGLRLGLHRRARPARPGHRAQQPARPSDRVRALRARRRRHVPAPRCAAQPYGVPYAPASNQLRLGLQQPVLNNAGRARPPPTTSPATPKYRDGVLQGMDYLLGRNALNQSVRHRLRRAQLAEPAQPLYAHQLDPTLPNPPRRHRSPAARTPAIQDPVAQAQARTGCKPQFCYIDDIESWSTNELAINWNAPLAWVAVLRGRPGHPSHHERTTHLDGPARSPGGALSSPWAKTTR